MKISLQLILKDGSIMHGRYRRYIWLGIKWVCGYKIGFYLYTQLLENYHSHESKYSEMPTKSRNLHKCCQKALMLNQNLIP